MSGPSCPCGHAIDAHGGFVNMTGCLDCTCDRRPSDVAAAAYDHGWADGYNRAKVELPPAVSFTSQEVGA